MLNRALILMTSLLLASCSATQEDLFVREREGFSSVAEERNYHLLLAEMAMARDALAAAAVEYHEAAKLSGDPELARRATHVAFDAGATEITLASARRWARLDPEALEPHHFLAVIAVRQGRTDDAVRHFERILQGETGAVDANFNTVISLLMRERGNRSAMATMRQLVNQHDDSAAAHYGLALIAANVGQLPLAVEAAAESVRLDPSRTPAQVLYARLRIESGERENVLDAVEEIVASDPGNIRNRYTYASLLLQMERNEDARLQFETILQTDPRSADALFALGLIGIESEDFESAHEYFRQLLSTGKRTSQAYFYLGAIAEEQERYEDAVDWYRRVTADSHFMDAQMRIARVFIKLDRLESARNFIAGMREANPSLALNLYVAEAELMLDQVNSEEAFKVYEEAVALFPENLELRYARALFAARVGNIALAESDLRYLLEKEPDDPDYLNALGYTLADSTDRYEEARHLIARALKLKPDEAAIIDSMGWVEFKLGNYQQAREHLQRAFDMTADGEIGAHLGEVLWVMGDRDGAKDVWSKAREKHPDNPVLLETTERLVP